MSNFWENQEVIGEIEKNKREKIVISICERQSKKYLDVRIHSKSRDSEQYVPTSKGFNIESSKIKSFKNVLELI